ncbi:T9SS type A sorting domain-containing protein [Hymenobacter sp. 15J16-1T3B]|uniref:T9SS type A sorting domain-containing protein n=1 Tax=Hymenobacter sp. 15J16-1T3B TaxID=2886941 RepID=UPI001D1184E0|nr:T9SS type A sorting domain-containing protein [Hymenobacter sp. 15J16-1T3B]MCC3158114.1 T9SS type A sorting domain-containing protein [Hymenobacter sp. 15J16-1T3B]
MRPFACFRFVLGLLPVLTGCDDLGTFDTYHFVNAPAGRRLNLARLLGEAPTLVSATDTVALRVRFERGTRTSLVLDAGSGDTLLRGWVTRDRGLYYFTAPLRDSTYWVHAWRHAPGTVQGLLDNAAQMLTLRAAADAGRLPAALVQPVLRADTLLTKRLRYDAALLRPVFRTLVDSCRSYRLQPVAQRPAPAARPAALLGEVYPNPAPAGGSCSVRTNTSGEVGYALLDARGRCLRRGRQRGTPFAVPLNEVPPGVYVLHLSEQPRGRTTSCRLVVE